MDSPNLLGEWGINRDSLNIERKKFDYKNDGVKDSKIDMKITNEIDLT